MVLLILVMIFLFVFGKVIIGIIVKRSIVIVFIKVV